MKEMKTHRSAETTGLVDLDVQEVRRIWLAERENTW